jgi:hypothetical protein
MPMSERHRSAYSTNQEISTMKRTLMIGVAAGALLAGVSIASAQGTMERQQPGASSGGASMEQQKGSAQQQKGSAQQQKAPDMKGTTGQAQQGQRAQDQRQGDQKAQGAQKMDQKQDAQKSGTSAQGDSKAGSSTSAQGSKSGSSTTAQGSASGGKVSLNTEQKTKIRESVLKSGPRVSKTNINFSLSVGTVVPRTVTLAPLPAVLVEINPSWRSYQYFIVEDEIVIVEPGTLRIITIINV